MLKQIDELKREAEQGSQQTQGEVLELELEEILTTNFPSDQIEPVAKGKRGADILQKVHNQQGQFCGTIIWESKRTKLWNDSWIEKLKDDQREAKAEIAVLVTTAFPRDVNNFAHVNGVWVTNYTLAICLAVSLRMNLIQVASAKMFCPSWKWSVPPYNKTMKRREHHGQASQALHPGRESLHPSAASG